MAGYVDASYITLSEGGGKEYRLVMIVPSKEKAEEYQKVFSEIGINVSIEGD